MLLGTCNSFNLRQYPLPIPSQYVLHISWTIDRSKAIKKEAICKTTNKPRRETKTGKTFSMYLSRGHVVDLSPPR